MAIGKQTGQSQTDLFFFPENNPADLPNDLIKFDHYGTIAVLCL
jgi:hypothetical protein